MKFKVTTAFDFKAQDAAAAERTIDRMCAVLQDAEEVWAAEAEAHPVLIVSLEGRSERARRSVAALEGRQEQVAREAPKGGSIPLIHWIGQPEPRAMPVTVVTQ